MKRLERKWARLAIVMVGVVVCSLALLMITGWSLFLIPMWISGLSFVAIRRKKLACPYCKMVYIPPRWDSRIRYRCRHCHKVIYYDDDGEIQETNAE